MRTGRPKKDSTERKKSVLTIRLTKEERKDIDFAANGKKASTWARGVLVRTSKTVKGPHWESLPATLLDQARQPLATGIAQLRFVPGALLSEFQGTFVPKSACSVELLRKAARYLSLEDGRMLLIVHVAEGLPEAPHIDFAYAPA